MSSLSEAEDRARLALSRLEQVFQARAGRADVPRPPGPLPAELAQETEALLRQVAGLKAHRDRLLAAVDEVEARVDGVIDELDRLAGE